MISSSSSSILRRMVGNGMEVGQYLFCDIFFALLHITIDKEVVPVVQLADVHLCILRSWIRLFQTNVQLLDLVLYNHYVVKTYIGFKQLFWFTFLVLTVEGLTPTCVYVTSIFLQKLAYWPFIKGWLAIAKLKPLSLFIYLNPFVSITDREMKSESGFSLAMASQPFQYCSNSSNTWTTFLHLL